MSLTLKIILASLIVLSILQWIFFFILCKKGNYAKMAEEIKKEYSNIFQQQKERQQLLNNQKEDLQVLNEEVDKSLSILNTNKAEKQELNSKISRIRLLLEKFNTADFIRDFAQYKKQQKILSVMKEKNPEEYKKYQELYQKLKEEMTQLA